MQPYDEKQGDRVIQKDCNANSVLGEVISVRTDMGTRIAAWRPKLQPYNMRRFFFFWQQELIMPTTMMSFFCHGYSFETYVKYGYSVMGGGSLRSMLSDEYIMIGDMKSIDVRSGDIVVMLANGDIIHSAVIINRVLDKNGNLDENLTTLNSKKGTTYCRVGATYATVMGDYPKTEYVQVYRKILYKSNEWENYMSVRRSDGFDNGGEF